MGRTKGLTTARIMGESTMEALPDFKDDITLKFTDNSTGKQSKTFLRIISPVINMILERDNPETLNIESTKTCWERITNAAKFWLENCDIKAKVPKYTVLDEIISDLLVVKFYQINRVKKYYVNSFDMEFTDEVQSAVCYLAENDIEEPFTKVSNNFWKKNLVHFLPPAAFYKEFKGSYSKNLDLPQEWLIYQKPENVIRLWRICQKEKDINHPLLGLIGFYSQDQAISSEIKEYMKNNKLCKKCNKRIKDGKFGDYCSIKCQAVVDKKTHKKVCNDSSCSSDSMEEEEEDYEI